MEKFAWPGGYEIFAVMDDGEVLCADCVNFGGNPTHTTGENDGWKIIGYDNTSNCDEPEHCAHCNRTIE